MKPWSISTTVRSPERLRNFLRVLQQMEGEEFDRAGQIRFQVLLIQERLYRPGIIPQEHREAFRNLDAALSYEAAEEIFVANKYEDPPMRGRQSANPLSKLGFAIARGGHGAIRITDLGKRFLSGEYDVGEVFFKSLLKPQYPKSRHKGGFSRNHGFNVLPLVRTAFQQKTAKRVAQ